MLPLDPSNGYIFEMYSLSVLDICWLISVPLLLRVIFAGKKYNMMLFGSYFDVFN